jgi:hypothetical protein
MVMIQASKQCLKKLDKRHQDKPEQTKALFTNGGPNMTKN